jgi:putative CocE/NonD family hydrolase
VNERSLTNNQPQRLYPVIADATLAASMTRPRCFFAVFGLFFALTTQSQQAPDSRTRASYISETDVAVPMRDGVVLRANVLRPEGVARFPVLVYRTPYGKEDALKDYTTFRHAVERGYAVMVQDVRGRYASGGEFRPYQNEGRDGYDTIEWAAIQPWSNGKVGTFGLSYPGAVQWLAAVENPPHLVAMVPAMTFSTPQNFFYAGGTWDMSWMEWIWDNIAFDARTKRGLPGPKTYNEAIAGWEKVGPKMQDTLPLRDLAELKDVAPYYYDWLSHPADDPWWNWCELRNRYDRVQAAVLNLSAWYDDNYGPEGATTNYSGLLKARAGSGATNTTLLLGPWVHGVDETAKTKAGEREFGQAAAIDYEYVVFNWMDHYLRGLDNGVNRAKPARYFVMGTNLWRDSDVWPPVAERTSYYLTAAKGTGAGGIQEEKPSRQEAPSSFVSDPDNPVRNIYSNSGAHDYRELAKRTDVLTFDSAALDRDTEVTGPIEAKVYVSCDCRDLDLWVRILDVAQDGTAFNLMSPGLDVQRASYRDLVRGRQLLTPGQVYEITLEHLITSNVFLKGHTIRVQISGSFFPNFSRNLQSGELENSFDKMQKATIRVYHDADHPSHIILPIVGR